MTKKSYYHNIQYTYYIFIKKSIEFFCKNVQKNVLKNVFWGFEKIKIENSFFKKIWYQNLTLHEKNLTT